MICHDICFADTINSWNICVVKTSNKASPTGCPRASHDNHGSREMGGMISVSYKHIEDDGYAANYLTDNIL